MKEKQKSSAFMHFLFKLIENVPNSMKLTFVFLLLTLLSFTASAATAQRLSISVENAKIEQVLSTITQKTGLSVAYSKQVVNLNRRVSIHLTDVEVDNVMDRIVEGTTLSYEVKDGKIYLFEKSLNTGTPDVKQQSKRVTGVVTDNTGAPLAGVTVLVKGTTQGVVTDMDGKYTLPDVAANATLQYSFIGMKTIEVASTGKTQINVTLEDDSIGLDEVVAIGYGYTKKSDLTGAVSSVKSEDLMKLATSSPVQALQGRAAGVTVVQESGSPDAVASIKIRGVGTTNNADPLYVVDGFPMSNINYLAPSDIESLEILKDASASAIYGSRGANGVVLVTTKKGKAGALKVNVNAYYGIENLANKPTMMNSEQYATLSNVAYVNAGESPLYPSTSGLQNTDWYKEVSRTGTIQNYNVSLSGGGENITSLFSVNYYDKSGIINSTDFARYSVTQNNTMKVGNFLNISTSLSASFSDYKRMDPTSIFLSSLIAPPDVPVWNDNTNYYSGIAKIRLGNPAGRIARNNDKNSRTYLIGNINADLNITKELVFNTRFGIRYNGAYESGFTPVYYETMDNSEAVSNIRRETFKEIDWTWENILTYHKVFGEIHDITVMAGISAREFNRDWFRATKQNLPIEEEEYWYFDAATLNPQADGNGTALSMLSYLGRFNYNLANRYLITASIRRDGSSRFLPQHRWGTFPSAALAWKLSEEGFFKSWEQDWLNSVKVRVGYGELGNENIGNIGNINSYYPYLTPIQQRQYYTLGTSQERINGAGLNGIGNAEAQWETSSQTNAGLDLLFINGKLSVTADYFIRKTNDILLSQQIPQVSGSGSIIRNVGGIENKGLELTVGYKDSKGDFSYNISGNMALIKNQVTNLGTSTALIAGFNYDYVLIDFQGALPNVIRSEVGKPYGQFYGYQTDGIFQNQAQIDQYAKDGKPIQADAKPGDFKFKDNNGNGRIDDGDMAFLGNPNPDVTYGLSFDAQYKQFDLNLLFQGVVGNDIYNAAKYYFQRFDARNNMLAEYRDEYWHGEGTSNTRPIITRDATRNSRNYRNSDYYVENGSYLRLKTVQLGYNLVLNNVKGKPTFRFYISAQNLLTFTNYSGFEPEVSDASSGRFVDRGQYPQSRTFMLGTVINF
ncbi:SusC/RagA family TonB-linked outer membrane protein [Bacteroidia bacterium]|nr:SusC/RagA family TonB-linked outer membrane protein [Bacteroidia bacterium]